MFRYIFVINQKKNLSLDLVSVNRSNAPKKSLLPIYLLFRFNFFYLLQLKTNLVSFFSTYVFFLKINTFLFTQKVRLFLSTKTQVSWESVSKRECVSLRERKTDCVSQCNSLCCSSGWKFDLPSSCIPLNFYFNNDCK